MYYKTISSSNYFQILTTKEAPIKQEAILERALTPESKIIFLDIDNILNRANMFSVLKLFPDEISVADIKEYIELKYPRFITENKLTNKLINLQRNHPELKFVIISDWRKYFPYKTLKSFLQPLDIIGSISSTQAKIPGIISWWEKYGKDIVDFNNHNFVILDDNIIGNERPYLPQYANWMTLVKQSKELDQAFKASLLIPLSLYGETIPLGDEHIATINQRIFP